MDASELELKLESIEKRLARIENKLLISAPQLVAYPAISTPQAAVTTTAYAPSTTAKQPQYSEPKPGNWLGFIAVLCFVLAAGFIIKLSIDSGWLTPARQLGIVILFGFGLIGAGFKLLGSDRAYASLLPGAGVIVLYIATFAGHGYYWFFSFATAIGLSMLVSALCIGLYLKIRHDFYPITAAVGSYIAPIILGFNSEPVFSIYYFLICSVAFVVISAWTQSRLLTLVSAYLAIMITGAIGLDIDHDTLVANALLAHFLIFSVGTYFYTIHNNTSLTESESWSMLPVLLAFYALEYYFLDHINPALAPWLSLGFAGVLVGLYLLARPWIPDTNSGSKSLVIIFTTIVCFHSIYLELLPASVCPWLFVLFVLSAALVPNKVLSGKEPEACYYAPFLAVIAIVGIEYFSMIGHLLISDDTPASWLAVSFASLASLWVVLAGAGNATLREKYEYILLGAAHTLAISAFYHMTQDINSLAVSASWLFYAIAVMAFAFVRKDAVMAKSALLVLGLAAGKALLYDAAAAATIVRIICLLLTGMVLYGAGFAMRKISGWGK